MKTSFDQHRLRKNRISESKTRNEMFVREELLANREKGVWKETESRRSTRKGENFLLYVYSASMETSFLELATESRGTARRTVSRAPSNNILPDETENSLPRELFKFRARGVVLSGTELTSLPLRGGELPNFLHFPTRRSIFHAQLPPSDESPGREYNAKRIVATSSTFRTTKQNSDDVR